MSRINSSGISTNSENFKRSNDEDDDIAYLFTVDSSSDEQMVLEIDLQTQILNLVPYKSSVTIVDLTHKSEADDMATNDSIVSIEEPETTDDETDDVAINDSVVIIEEPEATDYETCDEQTDEANESIIMIEEYGSTNVTDDEKGVSAKQSMMTIEQPESRTPSKSEKRKFHQKENKKKKRYSNQLRCAACFMLYGDVRGSFYISNSCNHVFCGQCLLKDANTESCPTCGIKFFSFRRMYL